MSKRLVLLNRDTFGLARASDITIPFNYCIGITSQLEAQCKSRGIEFVNDADGSYDPFAMDLSEKDTVFLALSAYESVQKIMFIRAKEHNGNCGYAVMMSGFMNNCHPSFMGMWVYASAYQMLVFNTPVDLMGVYSGSNPLGKDTLNDENSIFMNGFPFPVIPGQTKYNSEASTRIKVGLLVEPSTPNGLSFLVALRKLQEHNDITCFYFNSPMRVHRKSALDYEDSAMALLKDMAPIGKKKDMKNMHILVQTLPYSPRQLYHCAKGVEEGSIPILFDPAKLYEETSVLQTFTSPMELANIVEKTTSIFDKGSAQIGTQIAHASNFFGGYIPRLLDMIGMVKEERNRIKQ